MVLAKGGTVRKEPVLHIDLAATSLYFAGIEIPKYMEARTLFGPNSTKREFAVSARDRCDETYDRIRAVRSLEYKYIRNGYPERPHLQPCAYKDNKEIYIGTIFSDMKVYLNGLANMGRGDRLKEIKSNIAQMKKWWKEGK